MLAHLYNSSPRVGSKGFYDGQPVHPDFGPDTKHTCTIWTLMIRYHVFNLKSLLQYRALENLLLDSDLDSYPP